ncbi:MAG: Smr/MutS family protein [Mesorhizobium sp.]
MSRNRSKDLTEEDRILWDLVARSVTPATTPKRSPKSELAQEALEKKPAAPPKPERAKPVNLPSYQAPSVAPHTPRGHMDAQTIDKLARGRLALEARVDLHGMRQDEAYGLLLSFVARAHDRGVRYVLVITGKGSSSGGDGVLKRSVPGWLSTAPFRQYVSAHEGAARGHGGTGALYVRLKRVRAP